MKLTITGGEDLPNTIEKFKVMKGACSFCLNKDLNHPNKVPIKDFTQYFTHVLPVYA